MTARAQDRPQDHGRGARVEVVHVITTLTTGGAERQLEMLTTRSRRRSLVVTVYADGPVADALRAAGHEVVALHATGWRKPVAPLLLAALLRRVRPDVVHVHLLSAQVVGIPAARLARVPVVVSTEHSLMETTIEGHPHRWWLRLLYRGLERMTTHTLAVSTATSERLGRWGVQPRRISVTTLGVDLDAVRFNAADRRTTRAELGLDEDAFVIGVVARLVPIKRVDVVLRAAAPLLRDGAVLVVAGDGPLDAALRDLAVDLGVAGSVHWLGPRDPVGPVLSASDVMLSASADETFGMAVVEALGNGLPVVYAACPALDELGVEVAHALRVPTTGDDDADVDHLRAALVRTRGVGSGVGRWPVPVALVERYGAQAAADRVDAVHDRLLARA